MRGVVQEVARIVVLRANAVGDYLLSLPALHGLREAYPQARIVLAGAPWHARTLSCRPGPVDEVVVLPTVPRLAGLAPDAPPGEQLPAFLAEMRRRRFDLAVQLHGGGAAANPLVREFGARLTAGLRARDAAPLDRWVPYRFYQPEVARALEVVALVGARHPVDPVRFAVTAADRAKTGPYLPTSNGTPLVALHPGASDERRRWPAERFAALGDALAACGAAVLVTGTAAETDLVTTVTGRMRAAALPLAGAFDLGGLAACYERCALVVSNDTGPRHLAEAVGTPTVGLFWCGNAINAAPATRSAHRVLLSWTLQCPQCGADCTRDLYPHRHGDGCTHRCSFVTDIPVAEAIAESVDLLEWAVPERALPERTQPQD
ncbi:MAG TPA: glycosyltransferase family 9 protein [Pseudonocardiaceae bacterium]|nr:glycosyltransferase family 9 protein [Pseudonocardiaceae bacterium]